MFTITFSRSLFSLSRPQMAARTACRPAFTPRLQTKNMVMFHQAPRYFTTATNIPPVTTPPVTTPPVSATPPPSSPTPAAATESVATTLPRPLFRDEGPSPVSLKIPIELRDAPFPNPAEVARKVKSPEFKGKLHFFLLDFETTGMSKKELPRILELSTRYLGENGKRDKAETTQFYTLSDPGIASSIYAFDYHRIMRSEVRGKPPIEEVMKNWVLWVNGLSQSSDVNVFLTTHFSKTEKLTLAAEFGRAGVEAPANWTFVNSTNILDSVLTGTEKSQKIENIYHQLFGHFPEKAHRSEADLKTLFECINKVFTDDEHFKDTVLGELAMGEPSKMI